MSELPILPIVTPTPYNGVLAKWMDYYALLDSKYVREAISTTPLLAGHWQDYPSLQKGFISVSVIQLLMTVFAFVSIGLITSGRKQRSDTNFDTTGDQLYRTTSLLKPISVLLWQAFVGIIGICLSTVWMSSPTTMAIMYHSWFEFTIFILSVFTLVYRPLPIRKLRILKYVLFALGLSTATIFMSTGDIYIKAALGGLAFFTDWATVISGIIANFKLRNELTLKLQLVDILSTCLSISHIFVYYPEAFVSVFAHNDPIYKAGLCMVVFTSINLVILGVYIFFVLSNLATNPKITFLYRP